MKPNHCMIDIETLDTDYTGVILSIGAVAFDPYSDKPVSTFYTVISIDDCILNGLTTSKSCVEWWSQQTQDAQSVLKEAKQSTKTLRTALTEFSIWFKENNLKYMWGNGVGFDNVMLNHGYKQAEMNTPWKFWDDLCYRTVKTLNPNIPEIVREGVYHNALADALHQVKNLQKIFRRDTSK